MAGPTEPAMLKYVSTKLNEQLDELRISSLINISWLSRGDRRQPPILSCGFTNEAELDPQIRSGVLQFIEARLSENR